MTTNRRLTIEIESLDQGQYTQLLEYIGSKEASRSSSVGERDPYFQVTGIKEVKGNPPFYTGISLKTSQDFRFTEGERERAFVGLAKILANFLVRDDKYE